MIQTTNFKLPKHIASQSTDSVLPPPAGFRLRPALRAIYYPHFFLAESEIVINIIRLCRSYGALEKGVDIVMLQTFRSYGPHERRRWGMFVAIDNNREIIGP